MGFQTDAKRIFSCEEAYPDTISLEVLAAQTSTCPTRDLHNYAEFYDEINGHNSLTSSEGFQGVSNTLLLWLTLVLSFVSSPLKLCM